MVQDDPEPYPKSSAIDPRSIAIPSGMTISSRVRFAIMARDPEMAVRKEAAFAIANASERTEVINDLLPLGKL